MSRLQPISGGLIAIVLLCVTQPALGAEQDPAGSLFNDRILPIFRSERPSSCVQCHLASVDLKNYILPSSDATFASLRDQGLVDLDAPSESKILTLIRMGEKDLDEGAKLIHADMRAAELEAFTDWIKACCSDSRLRQLPQAEALAKPAVPDEVIRHARKSRIVDSFVRNVWSQRMRCFPCHTPHEVDPDNPKHQGALKTQKQFREKYGPEMLERLTIFHETPEATLKYLVEDSQLTPTDRLPLINLDEPTESLLVLKPMSKLPQKKDDGGFEEPTYKHPISHMGGLKLHKNDQSYKSIVGWIRDYGHVVGGEYKSIDDLPADNWHPSQLVVRLKNAPEAWSVGSVAQLFLHDWDEQSQSWSDEPIAFTQGLVTPRHMVNGALFLFGSEHQSVDTPLEKVTLPKGRYLVKVYFDGDGKIAKDPTALLSNSDCQGEIELTAKRWRVGFKFAQIVDGAELGEVGP